MADRTAVRGTGRLYLIAACCAVGIPSAIARAQGSALAADCVRAQVESLVVEERWAALRPSRVRMQLAPLRVAGRWSGAVDSLAALFLGSAAELSPAQRGRLAGELTALRAELAAGDEDSTARARGRVTLSRFQMGFRSELDGGPAYILFPATTPLVIDSTVAPAARRTICWLALAASDLATQFGGPGREALAAALEARVRRWDAFSRHGYSMLPHELLLNGLTPRAALEPPRWQVIVAHPSAGVQLMGEGRSLRDIERRDVLLIEPLGVLGYTRDRQRYAGAAFLVGLPSGGGTAFGASVHVGRVGRIAWLWDAERADGRRGGALVLSTDLYRYLGAHRESLDRLRAAAAAHCLADAPRCVGGRPTSPE